MENDENCVQVEWKKSSSNGGSLSSRRDVTTMNLSKLY